MKTIKKSFHPICGIQIIGERSDNNCSRDWHQDEGSFAISLINQKILLYSFKKCVDR